ncbi:MAG TPA: YozQ family protein [Bacillaceae bacterium]
MDKEREFKSSSKIGGRTYHPSDSKDGSVLSSGLAMTHEQVSDAYVEGTIDGKLEDVKGTDIDLPDEGFMDR